MDTDISLWDLCLEDLHALEEVIILFLHSMWLVGCMRLLLCSIFGCNPMFASPCLSG